MKTDRKLLLAVLALIGLVAWLLILTINRDKKTEAIQQAVDQLTASSKPAEQPRVINGKTPILGVDYFNGKDASDEQVQKAVESYMKAHPLKDGVNGIGISGKSAYDLAVINGFTGTIQEWLNSLSIKGDKGDTAPELQMDCQDGHFVTKYTTDLFWQVTKIKCETDDE